MTRPRWPKSGRIWLVLRTPATKFRRLAAVTNFAEVRRTMGNPLRFLGTGEPILIEDVTIPARCSVEITVRTHHQQYLLRPDPEVNEIILGCLGRAYDRYPEMNLHNLHVLSNHTELLATPDSTIVMASFMRDFLSTTATRVNQHLGRTGTFWERRYRAIPVIGEQKLDAKFDYILNQGTKENLVWSAREWPGVNAVGALLGGPPLVGRWRDHAREKELERQEERRRARAAARGRSAAADAPSPPSPIYIEYPIELVPMPHWENLKPGQRRARVAKMLRDDEEQTRARHQRDGTRPLGVEKILATSPFDAPADPKKSPAPLCHASDKSTRRAYRIAYRRYVEAVRKCTEALRRRVPQVGYPSGSFVPTMPNLAPSARLIAPQPSSASAGCMVAQQPSTGPPSRVVPTR